MPKTNSPPKYGHHKPSGQARVVLNGRHYYLGPYGSPESRTEYAKLIAGWKPEAPAAAMTNSSPVGSSSSTTDRVQQSLLSAEYKGSL